ncbi:glycosylphosphatidylinositol anchor biosynthesis [Pleosporales sp. CAS-2024a]
MPPMPPMPMPPVSDSPTATTPTARRTRSRHRHPELATFALLLAWRILNALTLRTFFQPDEFFQSLEPAWQLAFGDGSQAYITWEWKMQLRSSLHPALFALAYRLAATLAGVCRLTLPARAELLLVTPRLTQAFFAALLDCYTWKLAHKAYGPATRTALAAWFCSTRTLSNCLETTITTTAIYYWPWHCPRPAAHGKAADKEKHLASLSALRLSLLLAALACVLRPTNALVWLSVFVPTFWQANNWLRHVLVREILSCGSAVLACSIVSDRLYYGVWTLPPLRFLYFNIAQSLAVFYGKNRPDYYFTEALPLLLTTALPFAAIALFRALQAKHLPHSPLSSNKTATTPPPPVLIHDATARRILIRLAWTCLVTTLAMSLISHKEVRFLYPILPFLHVLAAGPLTMTFPANSPLLRKALLAFLLLINMTLALFVSLNHQRGVIDVLHHVRHQHELDNHLSSFTTTTAPPPTTIPNTTLAFLMPCHSTPWRSHLVYPSLSAWALTCEPPLHLPPAQHPTYTDEANQFYANPPLWLRANMESLDTIATTSSSSARHWARQDPRFKAAYRRPWPHQVVFFAQLEPVLVTVLEGTRYSECWRGRNSLLGHDDWRRRGDVVVWCLDGA